MQRIDENTYIDDTLVTCAEYQLFIDEMHDQGKYYQPDHWTSYQFLVGHAREPILGVRHSDAVTFCEWLTKRDGEWKYRLPFEKEVKNFSATILSQGHFGYWVNENCQFAWAGNIPKDARRIYTGTHFTWALGRQGLPYYDSAVLEIKNALPQATLRARVRELDITLVRDKLFDGTSLADALDYPLTRKTAYEHDLAYDIALGCALQLALNSQYAALDWNLDLCIDIFTMRERIAGRSSAFEGIRLVKERTR